MKQETTATPPPPPTPPQSPTKPSLSEEEMNKKCTSIIEEYIHIYDMKVGAGTQGRSAPLLPPLRRLRLSTPLPPLCPPPTGGSAVRAGAEQPSAAIRVCGTGTGLHAGAQHHCQGSHGSTAAPAGQMQRPPNGSVLQRVGFTSTAWTQFISCNSQNHFMKLNLKPSVCHQAPTNPGDGRRHCH